MKRERERGIEREGRERGREGGGESEGERERGSAYEACMRCLGHLTRRVHLWGIYQGGVHSSSKHK